MTKGESWVPIHPLALLRMQIDADHVSKNSDSFLTQAKTRKGHEGIIVCIVYLPLQPSPPS